MSKTNDFEFVCIYSTVMYNKVEALINLARTTVVTVTLALSSIFFIKDANRLVLNPIDRMLKKVKYISQNPLAATNDNLDSAALGVLQEV